MSNRSRLLVGPAWLFLAGVSVVAIVGMRGVHASPSLVSIADFAELYTSLGFTDQQMIWAFLTLPLVLSIVAAAVILLRRPDDRGALVTAIGLPSFFVFISSAPMGLRSEVLTDLILAGSVLLVVGFLVSFPTGRVQPRWAWLAPGLVALLSVVEPSLSRDTRVVLTQYGPDSAFPIGSLLLFVPPLLIAAAAQRARYRTASPTERSQVRWVLWAFFVTSILPTTLLLMVPFASSGVIGVWVALSAIAGLAIPFGIAVAVLRHNLFDIDRLLSRTVSYAALAVLLAAVYAVVVVGVASVLPGDGDAAVAIATLGVAAVFSPARSRLRALADRRFNRTRFDAQLELSRFVKEVSGEVRMDELERIVTASVGRTLQPSHLSLWIETDPWGEPG